MDKCKKVLGDYAVPLPYTGILCHPICLFYPSLDDFVDVNESVSESIVERLIVETNEPETFRKENGALIIEDSVSDSDEENVPKVKTVEMFNKSSFAKINFVKSTEQVNTVKGTRVNTARPKAVLSVVKENKGNVVKASACWVWRPKHKVLDFVSETCASMSLKDLAIFDAQENSKCSRHMTGNRSYLIDCEEIDGGFVTFGGRKPTLSFMRPFGCSITILNTIGHLGNQSNGNAGTKACDDAGKARMETVPGKGEEEKTDTKDPRNENEASRKNSEVLRTEEPREDQRVNQELDA
ncbi:hypothetical protein Tco_1417943 [Tanacetum coccineum]